MIRAIFSLVDMIQMQKKEPEYVIIREGKNYGKNEGDMKVMQKVSRRKKRTKEEIKESRREGN